jgi:tRNA threonylcarbamoyladenosine biosynthesis protein TsaB
MQLAIDTSTPTASIALFQEGEVVAELTWHSGQNHTVELLPNLIYLLQQAKADLRSVDGIMVAKGPGSYNGLRVGVSTAKGLCLALGVPMVGISSLEVTAFAHAQTALPICPIHNAGGGEIAAALYQLRRGVWGRLVEEHITTPEALCRRMATRTLFCGDIAPALAAQLEGQLGRRAVIAQAAARLRRAGFLAELGWRRLKRGDYDDLSALEPLYLRRPHITQPKAAARVR